MPENLTPWTDPELEARVVALVLGESSDFEQDQLRDILAANPELAAFQQRMESLHGLLRETCQQAHPAGPVTGEPPWQLPPGPRQVLLDALAQTSAKELPRKRRSFLARPAFWWSAAACFILFLAASLFLPSGHKVEQSFKQIAALSPEAAPEGAWRSPLQDGKEEVAASMPALLPERSSGLSKAKRAEGRSEPASSPPPPAPAAPPPPSSTAKPNVPRAQPFRPADKDLFADKKDTAAPRALLRSGAGSASPALIASGGVLLAESEALPSPNLPSPALEARRLQSQLQPADEAALVPRAEEYTGGTNVYSGTVILRGLAGSAGGRGTVAPLTDALVSTDPLPSAGPAPAGAALAPRDPAAPAQMPGTLAFGRDADVERSQALSTGLKIREEDLEENLSMPGHPAESPPVAVPASASATRLGRSGSISQFGLDELEKRLPEEAAKPQPLAEPSARETPTAEEPFSTFSLHVSDVSFQLAQSFLGEGKWPDAQRIRIEEFVNAFDYGDPSPAAAEPVACAMEQAIHPFQQARNLLRVSLRTSSAGRGAATPLRLTLLLDSSGSMERSDRRQTLQAALAQLAGQLNPDDRVTLIAFARQPRLHADQIPGDQASTLTGLVAQIPSEGGTNLESALHLAAEKALEHRLAGAENRIVLLTDGAANLGDADPARLAQFVEQLRQNGIAFDTAGLGADGLNDAILEALSRKGDGRYYLLDRPEDADANFARQLAGAFRPAARNVKVQVWFNPERVARYRLLGFEEHRLDKEDFRDDRVDAAELAAAEAGVALYQFEPLPQGSGDAGFVSVRFQDAASGQMIERRWPIPYEPSPPPFERAPAGIRLAASAAFLAAKLSDDWLAPRIDLSVLDRSAGNEELRTMIQQTRNLSHSR